MKKVLSISFALILSGCGGMRIEKERKVRDKDTKKRLAFELCMLYGSDQGVRNVNSKDKKYLIPIWSKIDSINFTKLVSFVKKYGYPNRHLLGKYYNNECVSSSAGVILLHNSHRVATKEKYFNLFFNEVKKGNMKIEAFVLILDKYYWMKSKGKSVLYGSQFGKPCLENKDQTNKARIKIGLKPLKDFEFKKCNEK